jgi:3-oxoacid CoA-transferase subunit B/acetate CoA/acetoacetate CoA-transferase beta subunit
MLDNRHFIARRAAQYFQPGDVVNLGVGIPSLCSEYTEKGIMFQTENGMIGMGETATDVMVTDRACDASSRPFLPMPGASTFDTALSFAIIRSGRMAATVLGGLQVSARGDLANWATPGRAFGMGGAMDLCNGARQVIVAMELTTKSGEKKIVNECSLPLTALRCVDHIVTEQCVIDVTEEGLVLREIRQGKTPEEIQAQVEPKLILPSDLTVMEE